MITAPNSLSEVIGNPYPLKQNAGKSFQGSIVLGKGFVLSPEEAERLIAKDPRNNDVLFPYLNGEDLNNDPRQKASRWVINFFDWSEEKARTYPDCFAIIEHLVKPERMKQNDKGGKQKWWQFLRPRNELYETISKLDQVMAIALTSKTVAIAMLPANQVFSHSLGIFSNTNKSHFAYLQSTIHNVWAWSYGSSMKSDLRYTPSVCFETFPFPQDADDQLLKQVAEIGTEYELFRRNLMHHFQIGLTKIYNLFHESTIITIDSSDENMDDKAFIKKYGKDCFWLQKHLKALTISYNEAVQKIGELRELHIRMDNIVLKAYGWTDIKLEHSFYEQDHLPENDKIRFTLHPSARKDLQKRLTTLNHQLYARDMTRLSEINIRSSKIVPNENTLTLF